MAAQPVVIQRLPYAEPRAGDRVDPHQFAGRRLRASSIASKLAFNDIGRMHVHTRSQHGFRRNWIPAFSQNNEQLRLVLAQSAWKYVVPCNRQTVPETLGRD